MSVRSERALNFITVGARLLFVGLLGIVLLAYFLVVIGVAVALFGTVVGYEPILAVIAAAMAAAAIWLIVRGINRRDDPRYFRRPE